MKDTKSEVFVVIFLWFLPFHTSKMKECKVTANTYYTSKIYFVLWNQKGALAVKKDSFWYWFVSRKQLMMKFI